MAVCIVVVIMPSLTFVCSLVRCRVWITSVMLPVLGMTSQDSGRCDDL